MQCTNYSVNTSVEYIIAETHMWFTIHIIEVEKPSNPSAM